MAKHELDPIHPGDDDVSTAHAEILAHQKALTAAAGDEIRAGAHLTGLGIGADGEPRLVYKPSGNLFAAANQPSALDVHFTTHGLTPEDTERALDTLEASSSTDFWRNLVVRPHLPLADVFALPTKVGKPAVDTRPELEQIEDAAWQLVARACRAGLILTIETTRHPDNDKVMGNYSLAVELRPSLAPIRERDARRALSDLEFERSEAARQPHI